MKSIKGLALGAALAGVVFTGAVTADAATVIGKDTEGTKYQEATTKLAALNITKGYPDGTVRPDENVTRAQTAAFMIRALNYQLAMDQSTTNFGDVGYDHPLSGAVQLASGRDIVKGYLDGTFRPEESVTIAQASAILVRMLGYSPAINEADFPNSHLSKAAELGILKNVNADVNAPAKRGDIMLMISNALTVDLMKQTEWGNDHKWEERKDENLLTEFFDLTVIETRGDFKDMKSDSFDGDLPLVRDTARTKIGSLKADEIEFAGGIGGTHTLNEMFNATDFLAQEVQVWIDEDDDYVTYIADSKDQKVVVDLADKWDTNTKIKLDNGDKYTVKDDARIYYNLESVELFDDLSTAQKNKLVSGTVMLKVVLDSNEDVVAMVATSLDDATGFGVVEDTNTSKETITFLDGSSSVNQLKLDGEDFFIVRDGVIASLEDIEADDVINYFEDDKDYYILATSAKASGEIEDVTTTDSEFEAVDKYKLFIDGKKYSVAPEATFSENKNEDIDDVTGDDLDEMYGVEATLYLDAAGDVRHISSGELDSTVGNVAVITKLPKYGTFEEEWKLTIINEYGKEVVHRFEADDIDIYTYNDNGKKVRQDGDKILTSEVEATGSAADTVLDPTKGAPVFIEYDTNKDNDLKSITVLDIDVEAPATNVKTDKYDDSVRIGGDTYKVTRNSVFFDLTGGFVGSEWDDVDTIDWDTLKDKKDDTVTEAFYTIKNNKRDLEYMFIMDAKGSLTSKGEYGFVTGFSKIGRDDAVRITRIDGEKLTLVYDATFDYDHLTHSSLDGETNKPNDLLKGAFIRYELDSDDEIDEMQVIATAGSKKGWYTHSNDSSDLESKLSIEYISAGVVTKSTASSVTLDTLEGSESATTKGNVVVNSNTVYIDLIDDGDMSITNGVNTGDFVVAVDTDDDGVAADFVIIIGEDYNYDPSTGGDDPKEDGKKVTYVNAAEGLIEVDGKVLELDAKVRLVDINGDTVTIGPKAVAGELEKGDVLDKIVVEDGVVTKLVLAGDKEDPNAADKEAAAAVDTKINNLPAVNDLTLGDKSAVEAARTAYNNLTANQKNLVENLAILEAVEAKIADLENAGAEIDVASVEIQKNNPTFGMTTLVIEITGTDNPGDYTVKIGDTVFNYKADNKNFALTFAANDPLLQKSEEELKDLVVISLK